MTLPERFNTIYFLKYTHTSYMNCLFTNIRDLKVDGYQSNLYVKTYYLIANNNMRSVILEIKNDRCKIVKTLISFSFLRTFSK